MEQPDGVPRYVEEVLMERVRVGEKVWLPLPESLSLEEAVRVGVGQAQGEGDTLAEALKVN